MHDTLALLRVSYHSAFFLSSRRIVFPLFSLSRFSPPILDKAQARCYHTSHQGKGVLTDSLALLFGGDPMLTPNLSYANLKESYLFYHIAQKTKAYLAEHPDMHLYRMGIGDVSLPLVPAVIKALHEGVDDQGVKDRFHGYMPEC